VISRARARARSVTTALSLSPPQAIVSDIAVRRGIVNIAVSGGSVVQLLGAALRVAFENRVNLQTEKWRVWCVTSGGGGGGGGAPALPRRATPAPLPPCLRACVPACLRACLRPARAGTSTSAWCRTATRRATTAR
jgi:hypothetical protein